MINYKNIIFSFFIIIMFLPMLEDRFGLINFRQLNGVQEKTKKIDLTKSSWLKEEFQLTFVKYIEENISFRNWLIRLRNQLRFSLFKITNADKIVIGKENYLFEQDYINAFTGKDFIGTNRMCERLIQIEQLQDYFKTKEKDLILMVLPGKASFYPEFLPERFQKMKTDSTNYKIFRKLISDYKINYIDLQKHFLDRKENAPYPLIPKCGIHWSYYGMSVSVDTLINYIEELRKIDLPDLKTVSYFSSEQPKDPDYDLGNLLNIIFSIEYDQLYYPKYQYNETASSVKPKVLTIGDSFYWNLNNDSIPQKLFTDPHFWYYNSSVYPESFSSQFYINQLDIRTEVEKYDIFLIMITEFGLGNIGYGFIETVNNTLNNNFTEYIPSENIVQTYISRIQADSHWMKDIERKARENNISLDEQLKTDAIWLLKQENTSINERITFYINAIKSDPEWLAAIKEKALQKNIKVDEMILQDAVWLAENENPK